MFLWNSGDKYSHMLFFKRQANCNSTGFELFTQLHNYHFPAIDTFYQSNFGSWASKWKKISLYYKVKNKLLSLPCLKYNTLTVVNTDCGKILSIFNKKKLKYFYKQLIT